METLPVKILEIIVQQLTPQDLARCSAVCREWREVFNQDWVWKPHCDAELEEPLRTIPCIVKPAFVATAAENSTLTQICCWRLAFMREAHLWKNWRSKEMMNNYENLTNYYNNGIKDVDFLTDTLVVVWFLNHIEIVDVSLVPNTLVAKTEIAVCNVEDWYYGNEVIGSTVLLVKKGDSTQVFNVDISNETITLKHTIPITPTRHYSTVAKDHYYISSDDEEPKLQIFDLNTGKLLKEETSPVKTAENERVYFTEMKSSPTSDFVACQVIVNVNSNEMYYYKYFIHSIKQLAFLQGPVAEYEYQIYEFALLGQWLATTDYETIRVYNFQTQDVLLGHDHSKFRMSGSIEASNDCFVFAGRDDSEHPLNKICIYFPSNRSMTNLCEMSNLETFRIINNKFIEVFNDQNIVSVWKLSGQAVEKCDFSVKFGYKTNRSFTKVLHKNYLKGKFTRGINYVW